MSFQDHFIAWCERRIGDRLPDKVILRADGSVYLNRWHVIPRNRIFNIYYHDFRQSDEDRAEHDHPWLFNLSLMVRNMYKEYTPQGITIRYPGDVKFRWGKARHRIELFALASGKYLSCRTIFITGPVVREWGFYCPKGWVHWKIFTRLEGGVSHISRGCE